MSNYYPTCPKCGKELESQGYGVYECVDGHGAWEYEPPTKREEQDEYWR